MPRLSPTAARRPTPVRAPPAPRSGADAPRVTLRPRFPLTEKQKGEIEYWKSNGWELSEQDGEWHRIPRAGGDAPRKVGQCNNFAATGSCHFGGKCKFAHGEGADAQVVAQRNTDIWENQEPRDVHHVAGSIARWDATPGKEGWTILAIEQDRHPDSIGWVKQFQRRRGNGDEGDVRYEYDIALGLMKEAVGEEDAAALLTEAVPISPPVRETYQYPRKNPKHSGTTTLFVWVIPPDHDEHFRYEMQSDKLIWLNLVEYWGDSKRGEAARNIWDGIRELVEDGRLPGADELVLAERA